MKLSVFLPEGGGGWGGGGRCIEQGDTEAKASGCCRMGGASTARTALGTMSVPWPGWREWLGLWRVPQQPRWCSALYAAQPVPAARCGESGGKLYSSEK